MLAFDIKAGKMQVSFMQPTVQQPKTSTDYRKIDFEVLARDSFEIPDDVNHLTYVLHIGLPFEEVSHGMTDLGFYPPLCSLIILPRL